MTHSTPSETVEDTLIRLLGWNPLDDAAEHADGLFEAVRKRLGQCPDESDLARWLCPQWIVLAAGRGSRIDPTGRMNKVLDIWIGSRNMLQMSCAHLIGNRPPIVVLGPEAVDRVSRASGVSNGASDDASVDPAGLDPSAVEDWCVPGARLVVQQEPNGPGGALLAAQAALLASDAETIGIAYGDEPFLDRNMFSETFIAHVLSGADATLCGKRPETVVDKGGLFFDEAGRFCGTKEWYDMTGEEQQQLRDAFARGEALTNAGISLLSRKATLERLDRLWLHRDGTEYHHTDLFRIFYDDGLRTHAHAYEGEVLAGVNRWSHVMAGEARLYDKTREALLRAGVRVHPGARVTSGTDVEALVRSGRLRHASAYAGQVHIGPDVRVGGYCHVEDTVMTGDVTLAEGTRVVGCELHNVAVLGSEGDAPVGRPIQGLSTQSELRNSHLRDVVIGDGATIVDVTARSTIIPSNARIDGAHLGIRRDPSLGMPDEGTPALTTLVPGNYVPGAFTFGERKDEPDWERLRGHIRNAMRDYVAPRPSASPDSHRLLLRMTDELLAAEFAGRYLIDDLTPEELWQVLFEMSAAVTGNADPYRQEKLRSRAAALELSKEISAENAEWPGLLRMDIVANMIDFTSGRMIRRMQADPTWLRDCLHGAANLSISLDSSSRFLDRFVNAPPRQILWLTDNDGETVFDLYVIEHLLREGHSVTVAGKSAPASNDATLDDIRETIRSVSLPELEISAAAGTFGTIASGSRTVGTNLFDASPEFLHALRIADTVIAKGQGNWYTTQGLRKDTFYMLLSKGMTAERTTGIVAEDSGAVGGLILAFVPGDSNWEGRLCDFAVTR